MDKWTRVDLDKNGMPILVDVDHEIHFANAKFNKSRSSASGTTRASESGNPWYDPSTGRFANGPAGVKVLGGGELLKKLLNSSKAYISVQAKRLGADSMTAAPGSNGRIKITIYKGGKELLVFNVTTTDADPASVQKTEAAPRETSPAQERKRRGIPENVDPDEWSRRMDQVRNAAREFDPQELEDIKEWLTGKTNRDLSEEEIQDFLHDVKRQRLSDLVDVLDNSIRRRVAIRARGRRTVRVVPPKGWVRRTMQGLEDNDVVELHRRLRSRGFSEEELEAHLINRYPDDRKEKIKARI
jgi:hypothetical protein